MTTRDLYSEADIQARIQALAATIAADYSQKPLVLVGVLVGGFIVLADLARALWRAGKTDLTLDFIRTTSYLASDEAAQVPPKIIVDLNQPIAGKHVLLVEDICDTGLTLHLVQNHLLASEPASLKTLAFLNKPSRRQTEVKLDYIGFEVTGWIEGYGLDQDRACPTIRVKS